MRTRTKDRKTSRSEQELLDFARVYLGEAFPNPERAGCPQDDELRALAVLPTQHHASIQEHLAWCSPCLRTYLSHLQRTKNERPQKQTIHRVSTIRRFAIACTVAAVLGMVVYVSTRERPIDRIAAPPQASSPTKPSNAVQTTSDISVLIDLNSASPTRGPQETKTHALPQPIPATSNVDLAVHLPLGTEEGLFTIALSDKRHVLWSKSARAHRKYGDTLFHVLADFSHVSPGNYDLQVSSSVTRLTIPVSIRNVSTTPEQKP